ncbi:hypothetical protein D3C84_100030 [compost metagenome]
MISKWMFSAALVLEAGSWSHLWSASPEWQQWLVFIPVHGLACALLCAAVWRSLPVRYRSPLPWSPLLIFSLAFFVPVFGTLGVMAIFPTLHVSRQRDKQTWQSVTIPKLPFLAQVNTGLSTFAGGGLQDVLRHAPQPEQRSAGLLATRRMAGREAVPILKLALGDPSDDVRLLAYSMLDTLESDINLRIQTALAQVPAATAQAAGVLHATLARWYWELAYLGLAQGSVLEHVLNQASEHAAQGLQAGEGGELFLLAGRIALERDDVERADKLLSLAQESGIDEAHVLPYRAELAFVAGRYHEVPGLLTRLPVDMQQRPPFAALVRSWT